ncbi:hypothetical protein [Ornithinibacillus californiensis]|uniref:hypothetical protein n=1 Tax=Ornithinibacillus californiensis TaxID=161536 RepID=UPI00064DC2CA|nr:hypothetical protein [Ornithinibacillus californiensis]
MERKNRQLEGFSEETNEAIYQLGELRDLELENYISTLIKRTNAVKLAKQILQELETMNDQNAKISDKDKKRNAETINHLYTNLQQRSLTPMEKRFIYDEIADLIRDMDSIRRYWMQKSLTGVKYLGAAGAVVAAALLFKKRGNNKKGNLPSEQDVSNK